MENKHNRINPLKNLIDAEEESIRAQYSSLDAEAIPSNKALKHQLIVEKNVSSFFLLT